MNSSFLFLGMLVLSGASAASATDNSGSCKTTEELNDLCGTHTFQSVKPILNYVDQLQREQLIYDDERKETNKLRAKVQELEVKLAEGKLNEKLIAASETAALSKDTHIKDLQATIAELRDTNHVLKQNVASVNNEIGQLKTFIQEKFNEEFSKINSSASELRYCEDQLEKNNKTIAEYAAQLKSKEESLQSCKFRLNRSQNVLKIESNHLKNRNETIARNTATISQLEEDNERKDQTLKNTQANLEVNQEELQKQKKITEQMKEEVTKLKEKIKEKEEKPTSCSCSGDSNVHNVKIPNFEAFPVLCNSEIAGPGWTVIQQRINGGEDFNRNWKDYKNGFGQFSGDFFLGLEKIHRLTKEKPHELYIHMEAFKVGNYKRLSFYARYDNFSIAGEDDKYRLLSLGTYSGDEDWDGMSYHEDAQFSTSDSDNDKWSGNCAIKLHAGWWYRKGCANCNLNGKYYQEEVDIRQSNWWDAWFSLKTIKMLIRPRGN